jgi:hypothetical protein
MTQKCVCGRFRTFLMQNHISPCPKRVPEEP